MPKSSGTWSRNAGSARGVPRAAKYAPAAKSSPIAALLELDAFEQRLVGPAVAVQHDRFHESHAGRLDAKERDPHACGGAAVGGVERVRRQLSHAASAPRDERRPLVFNSLKSVSSPAADESHFLSTRSARLRREPAARPLAERRAHRRPVRPQLRGGRREQRAARRPDVGDVSLRARHGAGLREPAHGRWSRCTSTARASASGASCASSIRARCRSRSSASRWRSSAIRNWSTSSCRAATRSPTTACAGSTTRTFPRRPSVATSTSPRA